MQCLTSQYQSGFRKQHSTITATIKVVSDIIYLHGTARNTVLLSFLICPRPLIQQTTSPWQIDSPISAYLGMPLIICQLEPNASSWPGLLSHSFRYPRGSRRGPYWGLCCSQFMSKFFIKTSFSCSLPLMWFGPISLILTWCQMQRNSSHAIL